MVHDKNRWLNVHDVILLRVKEQPVVEESQLGVTGSHLIGAGGQQPSNHSPPRNGHYSLNVNTVEIEKETLTDSQSQFFKKYKSPGNNI